jgi:hypothetical protein
MEAATSLATTEDTCDSRRRQSYRSGRMSSRPSPEKLAEHAERYAEGRTCIHCRQHKAPAELTNHYGMAQRVCKTCREDQKQRRRGLAADIQDVDNAPDPAPARAVRVLLELDRDQGLEWSEERYSEVVGLVLSAAGTNGDSDGWRSALTWSRSAWRRSYEDVPLPALTGDLLD